MRIAHTLTRVVVVVVVVMVAWRKHLRDPHIDALEVANGVTAASVVVVPDLEGSRPGHWWNQQRRLKVLVLLLRRDVRLAEQIERRGVGVERQARSEADLHEAHRQRRRVVVDHERIDECERIVLGHVQVVGQHRIGATTRRNAVGTIVRWVVGRNATRAQ
jgi:hypothetical protein